ncbi:thiamine pyrophosphokinase [Pedobacter cryophilus]|uniref:Thiamine pyrophosphokinase n=1 Tax=Pedobacter cryophilus TaxID=2571271 RepID=A0A4U1C5K0_9SPHI|nr:thiamine pyrophosphokinase [Pedobacter cryophilus]TKC00659.1 thiamine pyrophosphokinase [Pedobacter cryophilus]
MSSHHIVREKQEPALLVMTMDHFNEEYLGQLLEWSPTILVSAKVAEKVLSTGIKIDIIITPENELVNTQEHVKILAAKDDDDILEAALKHLIAEGYPAVNIITNHFQAKEYLFYVDMIDLVVFDEDKKIYPIKSGFSKWQTKGEDIYIYHPEMIHEFSVSGLEKINNNHYQTVKDGFFSFTFEPPFIFIAEQL